VKPPNSNRNNASLTLYYIHLMVCFQDNLGKPAPER